MAQPTPMVNLPFAPLHITTFIILYYNYIVIMLNIFHSYNQDSLLSNMFPVVYIIYYPISINKYYKLYYIMYTLC